MKRVIDIIFSCLGLIITGPIILLAAIAVFIDDPGPVLYKQIRVGQNGTFFTLIKLRSMRVNNLSPVQVGQVTNTHPLVTRVGRIIRRTKIDELPQLINVLLGHMSLVGPRPALPEQVDLYTDFERRRLLMRPGLTGWAQINGNTELMWKDRIALDVWYVDHWSIWLDLLIILRTVLVVLQGERPNNEAVEVASRYAKHTCRSGRQYESSSSSID